MDRGVRVPSFTQAMEEGRLKFTSASRGDANLEHGLVESRTSIGVEAKISRKWMTLTALPCGTPCGMIPKNVSWTTS